MLNLLQVVLERAVVHLPQITCVPLINQNSILCYYTTAPYRAEQDLLTAVPNFILKASKTSSAWLVLLHISLTLNTDDVQCTQDIVLFLWVNLRVRWAALCKDKSWTSIVMETSWWRWTAVCHSERVSGCMCVCFEHFLTPQVKNNSDQRWTFQNTDDGNV